MTDDGLRDVLADVLRRPADGSASPIIAVPSARDARAYIPSTPRRAAARSLSSQYSGGGTRRRVAVVGLSLLTATGLTGRLSRFTAGALPAPAAPCFHEWVTQSLGRPYRVGVVLLGPPRANRKPVVLLTDDDGQVIAAAKLGVNEVTRPLVRHEARALSEVASALDGHAHIPTLIAAESLGATEALLMRALPEIDRGRRVPRNDLIDIVTRISAVDAGARSDLRGAVAHPRMRPLAEVADAIAVRTAGVPFGAIHGDLHAGNLGVAADGRPVLWDWERWTHGIPLGFDLLHHDLQTWISVDGVHPPAAAARLLDDASAILGPLAVPRDRARDVAADYLIRLAARYVTDGQDAAGSRLGTVEDWIFPNLLGVPIDKEHT